MYLVFVESTMTREMKSVRTVRLSLFLYLLFLYLLFLSLSLSLKRTNKQTHKQVQEERTRKQKELVHALKQIWVSTLVLQLWIKHHVPLERTPRQKHKANVMTARLDSTHNPYSRRRAHRVMPVLLHLNPARWCVNPVRSDYIKPPLECKCAYHVQQVCTVHNVMP